jgi:hypothetical protein
MRTGWALLEGDLLFGDGISSILRGVGQECSGNSKIQVLFLVTGSRLL